MKKIKKYNYVLLLCMNAIISLYNLNYYLYGVSEFFYYFSIFTFIFILNKNLKNMLFFIRTFFLGIVGYLAYTVKFVDETAFFSFHMQETQSVEIATLMLIFTNIALVGSEVGLYLGLKVKIKTNDKLIIEDKKVYYVVFLLLFIVATVLSIKQPLIFFAQYATETVKLPIQNFNTIGNILLFSTVLYYFKFKNLYKQNPSKLILFFVVVYLLLYAELFRGARMDFLNATIGLIILYYFYTYNTLKINFKIALYGILGFILLQIIGLIRSVIATFGFSGAINAVIRYWDKIGESSSSGVLFNQGTINNIAATFSGTIYMIQNHIINFLYGSSYFDYILRIPPQFLYPDRPKSLAMIFGEYNFSSGGGFFELAEAYLNFGVFGVFIIPLFISFIISFSYKLFTINKFSLFHSILLFSIISVFMRGSLYQTFTFFKAIITGYILYLIIYLIYATFNTKIIKLRRTI